MIYNIFSNLLRKIYLKYSVSVNCIGDQPETNIDVILLIDVSFCITILILNRYSKQPKKNEVIMRNREGVIGRADIRGAHGPGGTP